MKIKRQKVQKNVLWKEKKLKFQDYRNCFKASQIINTGNYVEKN